MTDAKQEFIDLNLIDYAGDFASDFDFDAIFDALRADDVIRWNGNNFVFALPDEDIDLESYFERFDRQAQEETQDMQI